MLATAMSGPYCNVVYATLARTSGKRIIWPVLKSLIKEYKLKCKVDNTELTIEFENGSTIYLVGLKDASEIEKLRGLSIKLAVIDEAQAVRESILNTLIDDILVYACMDTNGAICLIGTPSPVASGYFYDATAGDNTSWSRHKWLSHDNPWIKIKSGKEPEELLAEERARKGITEEDPTYQREALALWVTDENALVIKFNPDRNLYTSLPPGDYNYVFGIDIGYVDADSISVLAYSDSSKFVYLIEECIQDKQDITSLALQIKELEKKYQPVKMILDSGALGRKIAEELRMRHGLNVEAAEKTRKMEFLELMNADFRSGVIKLFKGSRLEEDSYRVEWDRDTPGKLKISDRYHSDALDSFLYSWKYCKHYTYEAPIPKPPKPTDTEWAAAYEAKLMEALQHESEGHEELVSQADLESLYRDE